MDKNTSKLDAFRKARQAQSDAFLCRLFYFVIKTLVLYLLFIYKSPLHSSPPTFLLYTILLFINSYLIMTIGENPGFAKPTSDPQQLESISFSDAPNICEFCQSRKLLRQKHCFRCQKCVYKFDHHCPWIGACVGEFNQGDFWWFLVLQNVQAVFTMVLLKDTRGNYQYQEGDHYSGEYGALTIFILFMYLYILFVGSLVVFHSYLIVINLTTEELMKSRKLDYMKSSLPFNEGIYRNVKLTLLHNQREPIQWKTKKPGESSKQTFWNNKYYSCC